MKAHVKKIWTVGVAVFVAFLILFSCRKERLASDSGTARFLSIYLTDHACDYDSVFIDIQVVEVKIDTTMNHHEDDDDDDDDDDGPGHHWDDDDDDDDDHKGCDRYGKWDTLAITPGVYNILDLRNGVDTLLAQGNITAGSIRKIRITLGTNNSVVINGTTYPLKLFPGTDPYVYIRLDDDDLEKLGSGKYGLWLDFNICKSIVEYNGSYYLRPVIKAFIPSRFGAVEGEVGPEAANPFVTVFNTQDTGTAVPDDDEGEYKVRGLLPGTYSITFDGDNGYRDTTIHNVVVRAGRTTEVPRIRLTK